MDLASSLGDSPWNQPSRRRMSTAEGNPGHPPHQALRTPESTAEDTAFSAGMSLGGASPFAFQGPGVSLFSSADEDMTLHPGETGVSPTYFGLLQPELRTHGFDWLGFDMPDFGVEQWSGHQEDAMPPAGPDPYYQQEADVSTVTQDAPTTTRSSPVLRPMEPQQVAQPWPFDQFRAQDAAPHRYVLPPLKDVLQSTYHMGQTSSNGSTCIDDFVQLLSDQRLPALGTIQRAGVRQAFGEFQRLLDLYFDRFHDIQAIIHKPTWNMAACPTVLLTAMACIGALLSGDKRDAELSSALSDICMPMIIWLVGNLRFPCFLNARRASST